MAYVGIDFGTSNCVVACFDQGRPMVVPNREGRPSTPSVVTIRPDGTVAFGREAREAFDERRSVRSIKRLLGMPERLLLAGHRFRVEQIATMLFARLKADAERHLGEPVSRAVVTIPANSKGLARYATRLCAQAAGLQVLTLINEPTAAAIRYGIDARQNQTVLVYDFGGGTLDVTVLRVHHGIFEEIGSKGISRLGGDDLDLALGRVVAERFRRKTGYDLLGSPQHQRFLMAVEQAKVALSSFPKAVVRARDLVQERGLSLEEEVDRAAFERAAQSLIERSGVAVDEALARSGIGSSDVDRVLLVGGSSKIPLVRSYLTEKFERAPEPLDGIDPMTCVAQGAAAVSAILQGAPGLDDYAYSVRLEHSLCAVPVDEEGQAYLDPIIRRGSTIPCSFTKTYYPVSDPAERVVIRVYEGDVTDNPGDPENARLAEIPWEFDPPRPQQDGALEVTFEYGDDGILAVDINDPLGRRRRRYAVDEATAGPLAAGQAEKMGRINAGLVRRTERLEQTREYREAREVLGRAETDILPKVVAAEQRREIEGWCAEVRVALGSGNRTRMGEAASRLNDRLLDYAYVL